MFRTRFAPSPTGYMHIGNLRTALYAYLIAKKAEGKFILRIEDTDQNRNVPEAVSAIYRGLELAGISYDEGPDKDGGFGPYVQSQRLPIYKTYAQKLLASGHAYYCFCGKEDKPALEASNERVEGYRDPCRNLSVQEVEARFAEGLVPVVRQRIPLEGFSSFDDHVYGHISIENKQLDDQVLLKSDGFPTYNFANVVDDHLMGITHVVRGEEWISSTPKHLLLYRWLGWDEPAFAHMPLLRNTDKSKISKRKNPAARLMWFREQGYLPEALRNFLQLLAYPPAAGEQEVSSFEEFVDGFDWDKVSTVGPIFDVKKLDWLNGVYIRALPTEELADRIIAYALESGQWSEVPPKGRDIVLAATPLISERLVTLAEALPKLQFLFVADDELTINPAAVAKLKDNAGEVLSVAADVLGQLEQWNAELIHEALSTALVGGMELKPKFAFAPIRVAITGEQVSPPLFESMEILGKDASLARIRRLSAAL